jgi:PAS domain S-box-containing protein
LVCGQLQASDTSTQSPSISLTKEEKAFLAGRKIRIGVDSARPPFEFIDGKGAYSGISASFIQECAKRIGLTVEVVPNLTVAQAMGKAMAGEIDVIPKITPTQDRGKNILFTAPYNSFPSVIVSRKDAKFIGGIEDLGDLKVGVMKGLVIEELLKKDHPGLPLIALPNVKEALLELSTGKIDVFIDNLGTVAYNIDQLGLTNLKVAAPTPYTTDLAFGVRKDMPLLCSALDKALASMSNQERAVIKSQWLGTPSQVKVDWGLLGPLIGAAGLVALVILAWNQRLRRVVRERERTQRELEEHAQALEVQSRIKSHLTRLSTDLQGCQTFEELAKTFLGQIAPLAGIAFGSLHILNEDEGLLRFAGGYGGADHEHEGRSFFIGQGLIGQCAKNSAPIELTDPDGIPFKAVSGRGGLVLRELLILPIRKMERMLGVVALATPTSFSAEQRGLLTEVLPALALNLEILAGSLETRRLLDRSQVQAHILADAEQRSRIILDSISMGTLLIDPRRGTILDANPVAARMIGMEREALIGQNCQVFTGHQAPGKIENAEDVLVNAEGREIPVIKNVIPVVLGGRDFLLESFVDISVQRALENQLRESGEQLQIVSNAVIQSPAGVLITDERGAIEYVNPKFERLTGYTCEEVVGQNPRLLKSGLHSREFYEELWTTLLGGREWRGEFCNRKKNGELYWEQASISPIRSEGGMITHFVSVWEDITERKRLDEELKKSMDELERFTRLTVDRETRMVELEGEVNALLAEAGKADRYPPRE